MIWRQINIMQKMCDWQSLNSQKDKISSFRQITDRDMKQSQSQAQTSSGKSFFFHHMQQADTKRELCL